MKNESREIEFLNYIYQNAKMGVTGIEDIEEHIKDEDLKNTISKQKEEYQKICDKAIDLFIAYGKEETDLSKMAEISSYVMAKMKLMMNDSSNTIAKMMIEGSNKGIIEITEKLNCYDETDKDIVSLAKKLLETEQSNLEDLKKYL